MILKSHINSRKAYIKVSSIAKFFKIKLSDFRFVNVGNHKELQHYKGPLKIMFLDIVRIVEKVIDEIGHSGNKSLETMASLQEIIMADNEARIKASEIIKLGF